MGATKKEPNRKDRRFEKTEKAIRDALFQLISEMDFDKISISAIARTADIDRKTFYLHYDSVDALADAVLEEWVSHLVETLRESSHSTTTGKNLIEDISVYTALDVSRLRSVAMHMSQQEQIQRLERPLTEALFEDDTYGFGRDDPLDSYLVTFVVAGLLAMYRRWLLSDSEIPLQDLTRLENAIAEIMLDLHDKVLKPGAQG